jgi:hypothetical protein
VQHLAQQNHYLDQRQADEQNKADSSGNRAVAH